MLESTPAPATVTELPKEYLDTVEAADFIGMSKQSLELWRTGLRGSVLVDELWLTGENASTDRLRAQIRGALASDPTAKIVYISTVSGTLPRGMFANLLEYGRNVRDGKIIDDSFLPVFYEPWPGCPDPMKDESVWPLILA